MFEDLLVLLAQSLAGRKIPYMVIGGQAVLVYGEPRLTRDIDLTLGLSPDQFSTLIPALNEMDLQILVDDPEKFLRETFVLPVLHKTSSIRIDFIFSLSQYELDAISRAQPHKIVDTDVFFISLEDLLVFKVVAGRPRDLEDVRTLLIKNQQADLLFVRKWLKEYDTEIGSDFESRLNLILEDNLS